MADSEPQVQAEDQPGHDSAPDGAGRTLVVLMWVAVAFLLAALAGGSYILLTSSGGNRVAVGVSVAGLDIGGMSDAALKDAFERDLAERAATHVSIGYGETRWTVAAGDYVAVDGQGALNDALAVLADAPLADRLRHDLLGEPIPANIRYRYEFNEGAVSSLAAEIASTVDTEAVDARLTVEGDHIVWIPGTPGMTVDIAATEAAIRKAVGRAYSTQRSASTGELAVAGEVDIAVVEVAQGKTARDLGDKAILVDLSSKKLTLYEDGEKVKTWRVATGAPGFPTPTGEFTIIQKRYLPTWGNPGSGWAVNMPAFIPPGPTNPLGLRALNLSAPGIRIHGTSNLASIGTAASHGCVRMANANVVELYDMVDVGTTVFIVR